jgi:hypothetical protein
MKKLCKNMFCHPICTEWIWKTQTLAIGPGPTPPEFKQDLEKEEVQEALDAQFKVHVCSKILGCCDEELMNDYLENKDFMQLPIQACFHDPEDKVQSAFFCAKCHASVKVQIELLACKAQMTTQDGKFLQTEEEFVRTMARVADSPDFASYTNEHTAHIQQALRSWSGSPTLDMWKNPPFITGSQPSSGDMVGIVDDNGETQSDSESESESEDAPNLSLLQALDSEGDEVQSGSNPGDYAQKFDPGKLSNKGALDRCMALNKIIEPQKAAFELYLTARVCDCLGCCDRPCFRELTISNPNDIKPGPAGDL